MKPTFVSRSALLLALTVLPSFIIASPEPKTNSDQEPELGTIKMILAEQVSVEVPIREGYAVTFVGPTEFDNLPWYVGQAFPTGLTQTVTAGTRTATCSYTGTVLGDSPFTFSNGDCFMHPATVGGITMACEPTPTCS